MLTLSDETDETMQTMDNIHYRLQYQAVVPYLEFRRFTPCLDANRMEREMQ